MVELMAVLAIMGLGIAALLQTIVSWLYYAKDTENNIKAINIAREGIEGMINIRDTNWLRFSSDKGNCWRVKDYQSVCIGNPSLGEFPTDPGKISSGSYTIYSRNGVWFLSWAVTSDPASTWSTYKDNFAVGLDTNSFFTQTGVVNTACSAFLQSGCKTIFAREIKIWVSSTGSMRVTSMVSWYDKRLQQVTIDTILTNWKSSF